jgi:deazaflavin-dependent oxidoreductase (nitroreductase family)
MKVDKPEVEAALRQGFRTFNRFMFFQWRLGLGPLLNIWPPVLGRYMVIGHRGRKSGLLRRTPVNYAIVDGDIYCTAGFGAGTDWYRNLQANPEAEIWLHYGCWHAHATDVSEADNRMAILRQVLIGSGFAARLMGVNAHTMSDAALQSVSTDYRLVRFKRAEPVTGAGGPGDLAWVWPIGLMLVLLRRRLRSPW